MPLSEDNRQYIRRRGFDPDDISTVLKNPQQFSAAGFSMILRELRAPDLFRARGDLATLESLLESGHIETAGQALRLIVEMLGSDARRHCIEALESSSYVCKWGAAEHLCDIGTPADALLLIRYNKRHVTGRKEGWSGKSPLMALFEFLDGHPDCAKEREKLAEWCRRRWPLLSTDERHALRDDAPVLDRDPPRLCVVGKDTEICTGVGALLRSAMRRCAWTVATDLSQDTATPEGCTVLAIDASSYAIALRFKASRPVARLPVYVRGLPPTERQRRALLADVYHITEDIYGADPYARHLAAN